MSTALVMGNWKMHRGGPDAGEFAREVMAAIGGRVPEDVEVAFLPPFPALASVANAIEGTAFRLGAQSCHGEEKGAFTGEVSAEAVAGWGCAFVLCGHSERRRLCGEGDAEVRARVAAALRAGLRPVLCVGETLEEREAGRTAEVIARQVAAACEGHPDGSAARLEIAYEPVWAIGTGRNANPLQASETHGVVRKAFAKAMGDRAAGSVRVIYGGSVNPLNAAALLAAPGVDGALVGGASLDAAAFAAIVRSAAGAPAPIARGGH